MYSPDTDGIDHINVYSRGKTQLGRLLSNFAYTPFYHPDHGHFLSVEGWWYWLMTGDERLRLEHGFRAKQLGKTAKAKRQCPSKDELRLAYWSKIRANPHILEMLMQCKLPLAHYYVYNGKVVTPKQWQWTATLWDEMYRKTE